MPGSSAGSAPGIGYIHTHRLDPRPGGELARRYDGDRNLAEIELAGPAPDGSAQGAAVRIEWRGDRRPLRIERPGGGDHEFEYDALGRLTALRERSSGALATTLYEVDPLGRSVAETLPNGMRRERSFDAAGHAAGLVALRGGALAGELSVLWADARPRSASDSRAGGGESFAWDAAGRLVEIGFPGGERLEIARDLRGRRVRETSRLADGSLLREIGFGYDAAGRESRVTEDGALLVERLDATRLAVQPGPSVVAHACDDRQPACETLRRIGCCCSAM